jgi:23S rRNA pseudouridine1911/1915/1917 synthase
VYGVRGDLELERQILHAHALALDHPITGVRLEFASELPSELAEALERSRAEASP